MVFLKLFVICIKPWFHQHHTPPLLLNPCNLVEIRVFLKRKKKLIVLYVKYYYPFEGVYHYVKL